MKQLFDCKSMILSHTFKQLIRIAVLSAIAVGTSLASAQTSITPYAISVDPLPDLGKPVVRLERHRTCDTCRWYSITLYDTDRVLWHGKDSVQRLGYDIMDLRLPEGVIQSVEGKSKADAVVAMLRSFGFLRSG